MLFNNKFWKENRALDPEPERTTNELKVKLPADWPAAVYTISLQVPGERIFEAQDSGSGDTSDSGDAEKKVPDWFSNRIPIAIAPKMKPVAPLEVEPGDFDITIVSTSPLCKNQNVSLVFGKQILFPDQLPSEETTTFKFTVNKAKEGEYVVRLRVDGIDSIPIIFKKNKPPIFDPAQTIIVKKKNE